MAQHVNADSPAEPLAVAERMHPIQQAFQDCLTLFIEKGLIAEPSITKCQSALICEALSTLDFTAHLTRERALDDAPSVEPADLTNADGQHHVAAAANRSEDAAPRQNEVTAPAPPPASKGASKTKGKNIDAQMLKLLEDHHNCYGWSAQDFADRLGCAKSTVLATKAWNNIILARAMRRAELTSPTGALSGGRWNRRK